MTWVARSKSDVAKLRDHPLPHEAPNRLLRCGHLTSSAPAVSGAKTLYRCPNGCGLREAA
jgi:hypothetical protein